MDRKYKNRVLREINELDKSLVNFAESLNPRFPDQLTREALAATSDVLASIYMTRVDLRVKIWEFENGPDQGES